jgi:glycosyltransferase involved in cell wall biosynthesis
LISVEKVYHYITNIISPSVVISNRDSVFFEAGYNRVMFICSAITEEITIVSMGAGEKKGFFKKAKEIHSPKIKIVYLSQWHFTVLKKKIRHVFYSFFLFGYLIKNVKQNDKLILYNSSKSFFVIIPTLVFKIFRKVKYILEIEELYSYKKDCTNLRVSEKISINHASACIIANKNVQKFIRTDIPVLVNAGYYSLKKETQLEVETKNANRFQIIYSGRLDKEGGVLVFLDAIKFIKIKCRIVITGKGEFEGVVKNYICSNPLVEYCYWGVLNEEEYHQLLWQSQVAINPILQSHDFGCVSFPSKVTQYLTFGLKVVSSNIQSLNILNDLTEYIYTYSSDDPKILAERINSLNIINLNDKKIILEKTKKYFENSKMELMSFFKNV